MKNLFINHVVSYDKEFLLNHVFDRVNFSGKQ